MSTDKRFAFNHKNSVDDVGFALCFPWTRTSGYIHSLFHLIKCSIINSANALLSERWVLQFPQECILGWRRDEVRDEIGTGVWVKPISFASPVLHSLEQTMWPLLHNQEFIFLDLFQCVLCFIYGNSHRNVCLYVGDVYMCQVLCFSSLLSVDMENKTSIKVVGTDSILI